MSSQQRRNDTARRINKQIESVERLIADLLVGVNMDELTSAERLSFAARFMMQHARALALRQTVEMDAPESREHILIAALMRQMRGEGEQTQIEASEPEPEPESEET
jgi:hypothetical protein